MIDRGAAARASWWHIPSESLPGPMAAAAIGVMTAVAAAVGLMLPDILGLPVDRGITVLVPALFLVMAFSCWYSERAWVYLAIMSHMLFMIDATPDSIGVGEIAFGVIGLGGLAFWFAKELMIHRRRVIETGFDLMLAGFMAVGTVTTLIACLMHDGDLLQYVKEYGVVLDLLFYFPLRRVTTRPKDVIVILVLFVIIGMVNGSISLLTYRERLAKAVFQWQLTSSRSNLNEFTSQALFILGATIFAYARKLWLQVVSLGIAAAGLVFLLVSFSRSPIITAVLAIVIMVSLSPLRNGRRVVVALVVALGVGTGVAFLVFPQLASNIGQALVERVVTVAATGSDRSFNARLVESSTILSNYFAYSPVIGVGFGVFYKFLDPLTNTTITYSFVHNGYVWALFKYGLPMALFFHVMLVYPLIRLLAYGPRRNAGLVRAMVAGAVGYVLCSFVVNITSNIFTQVATILNVVICWTFFDYARRHAVERDRAEAALRHAAAIEAGANASGADVAGVIVPRGGE